MVSVRLSHDEFEELKSVCEAMGARSISDLTRTAMYRLIRSGALPATGNGHLEAQVSALGEKVTRLQRELAELKHVVRGEQWCD